MQETSLMEHIYKTLKGRRYMIVLDDIWDPNVLDKMLRCFPNDGNGSRILFTSRNKDVAPHNCIMHELPFFTDDQCWELLEKKAFGGRTCPPQLQEIGKKIAAKCGGLPLTVVIIAGVLSTVDEKVSRWEEVGGSLASYTNNSVMQILKLSYKHLSNHLKPCFLYFGEFKEDEAISVGKLKRLWVAEGFIRKEKDKSDENIAGEYLMELIDRSPQMIVKRSSDGRGVKPCVVHDLLRDLCLKISKEESFLKFLDNELSHISFFGFQLHYIEKDHRVRGFGECATLSYCHHVRSFVGNRLTWPSSFYVREMRLLRVLHFKVIDKSPIFGFNYLVNLRSLVTHDVPPRIDMLLNLEYLRVVLSVKYPLPAVIAKMKKLKYIHVYKAYYDCDWKKDQTNNLEYISKVYIYDLRSEELLKCSPHLRKLKCKYDAYRLVGTKEYPRFDLCSLTHLDSLSLSGSLSVKDFGFPPNIRKLTLEGSGLRPEMSTIGRLKFLEVLKLDKVDFMEDRWDTREGEFQELRFLQLSCFSLSEWNVASNDHFPKLQQLILDCFYLREIPCEIGEISTLELIEIKWGSKSLVESAKRIEEEQWEMGNEGLRVILSNDWYPAKNCVKVMELYNVQGLNRQAFPLPSTPTSVHNLTATTKTKSVEASPVAPPLGRPVGMGVGYSSSESFDHHSSGVASTSKLSSISGAKTETPSLDALMRTSSSTQDVDRSGEMSISNAGYLESELVEEDEPDVYLTIRALPDGRRELRRVRFSREKNGEMHARVWWEEHGTKTVLVKMNKAYIKREIQCSFS